MQECTVEQVQEVLELFKVMHKKSKEIALGSFRESGFTFTQLSVISILFITPNIMLSELSKQLGLSNSTVSELVKRLEIQGIVKRNIPEDNRRTVRLSLSPDFISKHDKKHLDIKNNLFVNVFKAENITFEEVEKIKSSLKIICKLLEAVHTKNIW